jgi:O-antigen ligase
MLASAHKAELGVGALAAVFIAALWLILPHPAVVVAAGLVPVAAVVVIRAPLLPILGFIVFSFFRIHEVFPVLIPLKIPQLLALASLATLSWHLLLAKDVAAFMTRELRIFLAMFVVITLSLPLATSLGTSMKLWSDTYVKIAIMTVAIAWLVNKPRDFGLAMRVFVVAGIIVAIKALMNKAAGIDLVEGTRVTIARQYGSPLGDPNDLSLALLFPVAFALALALNGRVATLWRLLGLAGAGLMVAAIIATQSRGGLLGTVAVVAVFARQYLRSRLVLFGGGAVALLVLFVAAGIADRHSGGSHTDGLDASSQGRLNAWVAGFRMAVAHPLTGVGIGNFKGQYFYYTPHWTGKAYVAHSTWFEMMGDAGFVACALLIALTVFTLITAFKLRRCLQNQSVEVESTSKALAGGLVGFVVSGTFLSQSFTWPLYIQVAMVAALWHLAQRSGWLHDAKR